MMKLLASIALAAVLVADVVGCSRTSGTPPQGRDRPDVLLISIDSLRADHLGCYGYAAPTSPVIDRLAAEGVRCADAVSTTSWTLPAHAALLTGLYDSAHGTVDNGLRLAESYVTLAETLHSAGYRTAGFYGGPYLHPTFGFGQGFDDYFNCMTALPADIDGQQAREESQKAASLTHADVTGPRTREKFEEWVSSRTERPLFAFVHLWDVHYDYIPPPEYLKRFDPEYAGSVTVTDFMRNPAIHPGMPARDLQHVLACYDGEIRFTDEIIGALLAALPRPANTLVIITADHGEEFFEHGGKGHQRTLYDEVLRVPLIFRWPGRVPAGTGVQQQVRLIDVMPTVLDLLNIQPAAPVQGRSLLPLFSGTTLPEEPALCELLVDGKPFRALRSGSWKVVVDDIRHAAAWFDLAADPGEQRPLRMTPEADERLRTLRRLTEESQALCRRIGESGSSGVELDPDLRRQLEQSGYIEPSSAPASRPADSAPAYP